MQRGFRVSLSRHVPASLPMLLSFLPPFLSLNALVQGRKETVFGGVAWPSQLSHTGQTAAAAMLCPAPSEDVGKKRKKQGEMTEPRVHQLILQFQSQP